MKGDKLTRAEVRKGAAGLSAAAFSEKHCELVNEVIRGATFHEAYKLGIASAAAMQAGIEPTLPYFIVAMKSKTVADCVRFVEKWKSSAARRLASPAQSSTGKSKKGALKRA